MEATTVPTAFHTLFLWCLTVVPVVLREGTQEGKDLGLLIVPLESCLTFTENVCMRNREPCRG